MHSKNKHIYFQLFYFFILINSDEELVPAILLILFKADIINLNIHKGLLVIIENENIYHMSHYMFIIINNNDSIRQ